MNEPESLQDINDLFWEAITLYAEGRKTEITPHIWRIMARVISDIYRGKSRKKIQDGCAETIGWFPSQQQIGAIRTLLEAEKKSSR